MKKNLVCLFLMFFVTASLFAGVTTPIKIDDEEFKKLKMSVASVENPKDSEKLIFTIQVKASSGEKNSVKIGKIYLFNNKKNHIIKPEIKDDTALIVFELAKNDIENAELHFSYPNGSMCPASYSLELKK